MNYPEIIEVIDKNFPAILEAYAIKGLSEEIMFNHSLENIDWKKYGESISKEKMDVVRKYWETLFHAAKNMGSFSSEEQKGLTKVLNKCSDKINDIEQ